MQLVHKFACILVGLLLLITIPADACSDNNLILTAQLVYDKLSSSQKQQADELAMAILSQLPLKEQQELNKNAPAASLFAKVTPLAVSWQKWTWRTLFKTYQAPIPTALILYENKTIGSWYFPSKESFCENFSTTLYCSLLTQYHSMQTIHFLTLLLRQANESVKQAQTMSIQAQYRNQQAILLILLTYYATVSLGYGAKRVYPAPEETIYPANSSCINEEKRLSFMPAHRSMSTSNEVGA